MGRHGNGSGGCGHERGPRPVPLQPEDLFEVINYAMDFTIEPVVRGELALLLELIRELARFEKLEHEVQTTVELLEKSIFGPNPAAGALLPKNGQDVAGYAIYYFTFSSFVGNNAIWLD